MTSNNQNPLTKMVPKPTQNATKKKDEEELNWDEETSELDDFLTDVCENENPTQ